MTASTRLFIVMTQVWTGLTLASIASSAHASPARVDIDEDSSPGVLLVESTPIETELDDPEIPDAHDVWVDMIDGASTSIDFAEFYAADAPEKSPLHPTRIGLVIAAIERAAARGVQVRFLIEKAFYEKGPTTADRLAAIEGVEVRKIHTRRSMGGVLHAKYFLVDGREAYFGSQNFDWRSLTHNHELGLRVRLPGFVRALGDLFETDWRLAKGGGHRAVHRPKTPYLVPEAAGDGLIATPAFSPRGWLPAERLWDLPKLVELIDGAQRSIHVELLNYGTRSYRGEYFDDIDRAIRRAAARGVHVEMLFADWSEKPGVIDVIQSLQCLRNVTIKLVTIPQWSGGFVPYARVIHAKYLVVDGARSWIGTSNWKRDYFFSSRNVGLVVGGPAFAAQLERVFGRIWESPYATLVDPSASYEAPAIAAPR